MKKIMQNLICALLICFLGLNIQAQTSWNIGGNTLSPQTDALFGTSDAANLNFITNGASRMTLKTNGKLGLGILEPRAWQEIFYCGSLNQEPGLLVTKFDCGIVAPPFDPGVFDLIGIGGIGPVVVDPPEATFNLPFSFLTGHFTNVAMPLYTTNQAPLFWARTLDAFGNKFDTKMIVMPDGSVGINIAQPRAALDVRGSQAANRPAAIFGSRAMGTGGPTGPNGLFQYYTQQIQIIPNLLAHGYNRISQAGDQGVFFSDGKGADGSNQSGSLVFAPWAENNSTDVGGMRMDAAGNVEFHGNVRATKVTVNAKWWSDFVFDVDYKLRPLSEVSAFIAQYKHLPDMPSESEVLANGIDVTNMQALQQQKIEELTLYVIELRKEMDAVKKEMELLKK
jgi:hypothetical protein